MRKAAAEPETIAALYQAGATARSLAARFGVSRRTISRDIRRGGGTARRYMLDAEVVARLYAEGEESATLAARFGCHAATVLAAVRRGGGTIRRRRHPIPTPRPCENCGQEFTPTNTTRLARGQGSRFCKYECFNTFRTGRPQREWK